MSMLSITSPEEIRILDNCKVLSSFEHLEKQGRHPQLAAYRGRTLVLFSVQAHSFLQRVFFLFRKIIYQLLVCLKVFNTHPKQIQVLKEEIYCYLHQKAQNYQHIQLEAINNQQQQLILQQQESLRHMISQKERLGHELSQLTERFQHIQQEKNKLEQKMEEIKTSYVEAQQLLQQKHEIEETVHQLIEQKTRLQEEMPVFRHSPSTTPFSSPRDDRDSIIHIREELNRLQASQGDSSSRFAHLEASYGQLQVSLQLGEMTVSKAS